VVITYSDQEEQIPVDLVISSRHNSQHFLVTTQNTDYILHSFLFLVCIKMMTMTATTLKQLRSSAFSMIFVVVMAAAAQQEDNGRLPLFLNRFTYDDTTTIRNDGFGDYSPQDWDKISCPPSKLGVDDCLAYHDKWHEGKKGINNQ
jgi:hypothetical protein